MEILHSNWTSLELLTITCLSFFFFFSFSLFFWFTLCSWLFLRFDGLMYANIYRGGGFVDAITLDSTHKLFSTEFILTYRPSYSGNYYFELFLEDPYRPSAEFVFDTSYTFTGAGNFYFLIENFSFLFSRQN